VIRTAQRTHKQRDAELAGQIGERIRAARVKAGLTQQQLAAPRYTKAYVSALEKGHAKPSMAALNFLAERLGLPAAHFLSSTTTERPRLEADLLLASGRWQEALDAYEELLNAPVDKVGRAEILRGQAEALCRLGRGLEAIRPATEAFEGFRALKRDHDAVLAGYWLANAHYLAENSAEARSILRMVLDLIRSDGTTVDPDLRIRLLTGASNVETWDGNHEAAIAYLEEARGISTDMDDRRRAGFLAALASAYYDTGDLEGAVRAGNQSLALFRAAEAKHETALIENNLANAYLALGNLTRARELVEKAHREHARTGDRQMPTILDTEARIELAAGNLETAIALAEQATQAADAVGNQKALTDAQLTLARTAVRSGKKVLAGELYERAANALREHGPRSRLTEVLGEWADLVATTGDHAKAYQLTREALRTRTAPTTS
jgi:tetratricopeptide (TPR) repeat protein